MVSTVGVTRELVAGFSSVFGVASPFPSGSPSPLHSVTLGDLYPEVDPDTLAEYLPLTRASALAIPSIAKARHTIVNAVSGLDLYAARGRDPITPDPTIIAPIDPGRARVVTLAYTVDAMMFYGRAWWRVLTRSAIDGRPLTARFYPEHRLGIDEGAGVVVEVDGDPVADPREFLRIDALHGGLLNDARLAVRRITRTEAAAARASDNPVPSVELHQTGGDPLDDPKIDGLIRRWSAARRGRNGGVAYSSPTIGVRTHGQAAEQLLINGRNASALDAARVCGVPAWAVDASVEGSSLTYSNVPSRSRELLDYTLRAYLDAITGRLSLDDVTPHGTTVKVNATRLLMGDFGDRMAARAAAIDAGIYTADEIRYMDPDTPNRPPAETAPDPDPEGDPE